MVAWTAHRNLKIKKNFPFYSFKYKFHEYVIKTEVLREVNCWKLAPKMCPRMFYALDTWHEGLGSNWIRTRQTPCTFLTCAACDGLLIFYILYLPGLSRATLMERPAFLLYPTYLAVLGIFPSIKFRSGNFQMCNFPKFRLDLLTRLRLQWGQALHLQQDRGQALHLQQDQSQALHLQQDRGRALWLG